jgi:hypothetical protein
VKTAARWHNNNIRGQKREAYQSPSQEPCRAILVSEVIAASATERGVVHDSGYMSDPKWWQQLIAAGFELAVDASPDPMRDHSTPAPHRDR